MGHYAVRGDLQDVFTLTPEGNLAYLNGMRIGFEEIAGHFGILHHEAHDLFNPDGCGNAQTREEAAEYIEAFCERKWPTPPAPEPVVEAAPAEVVKKVEERELVYV
jgi:hypothetical protein